MIALPRLRGDRPRTTPGVPDRDSAAASPAAGRSPAPGELALAEAPVGSRVVVTRVLGDEQTRGRLIAVGIAPGVALSVAGGSGGRPRVLSLAGCRMALDARSSDLVLVRHRAPRPGIDA